MKRTSGVGWVISRMVVGYRSLDRLCDAVRSECDVWGGIFEEEEDEESEAAEAIVLESVDGNFNRANTGLAFRESNMIGSCQGLVISSVKGYLFPRVVQDWVVE